VREEAEPLPDVHQAAEREPEDEAHEREGQASHQERREQGARRTTGPPREHLPRRPDALSEEEVRGERRDRADPDPRPHPERRAGRNGDDRDRLHPGHHSEEDPACRGDRAERCDDRELLGRCRTGLEPRHPAHHERERGEQQRQAGTGRIQGRPGPGAEQGERGGDGRRLQASRQQRPPGCRG
jgi:hypothetical protein